MVHSLFRQPPDRESKIAQPARRRGHRRDRGRRPKTRSPLLMIEPLEDRMLLNAPASTGQVFNLSSSSTDNGNVYLRENLSSQEIQYSTDKTNWFDLVNIGTGTGTIAID